MSLVKLYTVGVAVKRFQSGQREQILKGGIPAVGTEAFKQLARLNDAQARFAASFGGRSVSETGAASQAVVARENRIELPEMIALSDKLSIMKGEVRVGLFKQVMEGYEITGHNAGELRTILDDPSKAGDALTYVNMFDAREFAKRLSDLTGRKFRVQTEEEWQTARDRLSGNNWTWTETKYDNERFVLRRLDRDCRDYYSYPEGRYFNVAVRLVEDIAA